MALALSPRRSHLLVCLGVNWACRAARSTPQSAQHTSTLVCPRPNRAYCGRVSVREGNQGVLAGFAAYGLWGLFPLYFSQLGPAGAWEILAHRVLWTFVFCLIGLTVVRGWAEAAAVLRKPRLAGALAVSGVLVTANWGIYVWAVVNGQVVDAALGYFINPLVTVALAVVVLHERLRPGQIAALAIGAVAVIVLIAGYGQVPWVAIGLALTFGVYSLAKNRIGPHATPLVGLTLETTALTPVSIVFIAWLQITGTGTFTSHGPLHTWLLVLAGVVTALPLLLFAAAARRIPLAMIGLLQYVTPICQFLIGVFIDHEIMPPARWAGFGLIWCALLALTWDTIRSMRHA